MNSNNKLYSESHNLISCVESLCVTSYAVLCNLNKTTTKHKTNVSCILLNSMGSGNKAQNRSSW